MATIKPIDGGKHAGPSARDLTPYQWRAAKFVGSVSGGDSARAENDQQIDVAGVGDRVEGVIQYPGDAAGRPTTILTLGRQKVKAGEALKAGDKIKAGPLGVALKAAPGDEYFGSVIEGGPAGAIVPFEFDRGRQPAV
ncbi:hypothetical protein [Deinococcus murrayi]|uniref:hypothetical protein n=1 Tax=Deinococcus murrayi TaxID=68910 RepID=UPI00047FB9B2|nr:hypothetical protein [Deinococcus murrayi]